MDLLLKYLIVLGYYKILKIAITIIANFSYQLVTISLTRVRYHKIADQG